MRTTPFNEGGPGLGPESIYNKANECLMQESVYNEALADEGGHKYRMSGVHPIATHFLCCIVHL